MRTTIATMGQAAVAFRTSHRQRRSDPALVTISAPIELAFDDLVAVLFRWDSRDEIADDMTARELVAESVFNFGCEGLDEARAEMLNAEAAAVPGDEVWEWLAFCRQRVIELFGPAVPAPRTEQAVRVVA